MTYNFDNEYYVLTDRRLKYSKLLIDNLSFEKKRVANQHDSVILITGKEGSGKTVLGDAVGYFMGYDDYDGKSNFSLDWVCFTPDQFEELAQKAPKGQVLIWDEFVLGGLSGDAITTMQKKLKKIFTLYRSKNLIYILIIPSIFMLGWYFACHRSSCLINTFCPDGLQRGFFKFYNSPEKNSLYFKGSKYKTYAKSEGSFEGIYYQKSVVEMGINERDYEKKKQEAVDKLCSDEDTFNKTHYAIYKLIEYIKLKDDRINLKEIMEATKIGLHYTTISKMLERYREYDLNKELNAPKQKLVMPFKKQ